MEVLEWPGNSPDLNPIENLWSIVKNRLRKKDCTTKTKLIESVINVWFHDDEIKNTSKKLVMSMKKRVDLVLQAKGRSITKNHEISCAFLKFQIKSKRFKFVLFLQLPRLICTRVYLAQNKFEVIIKIKLELCPKNLGRFTILKL